MAGNLISPLLQHFEKRGLESLLPFSVDRSKSQCMAPQWRQACSIRPRSCLCVGSRYRCRATGRVLRLAPELCVNGGVGF